jgi:glycine/D-amino acid oxidase-like deaminating enzyme
MKRRSFVQLLSGVALSGVPSLAFQSSTSRSGRIVIAGAGIVGANIAYRLAKRGASVTVLERTRPAAGATANSFAWINAQKQPFNYFGLSQTAIEAWRQLDRELSGKLPVIWGGGVRWASDPALGAALTQTVRRYESWGYPIHLIDEPKLRALERNLVPGAVNNALHAESEGNLDPVGATEVLLAQAVAEGAQLQYPTEVTGLDLRDGQLRAVRTTKGDVQADVLVMACGVDTPKLAGMASLTVALTDSPGMLVHTAPRSRVIEHVVMSPLGEIKQKVDGRLVIGSDFGTTKPENATPENGARILQKVAAVLPQLSSASLEKVTLGWRPMPKDGHPIIGFPAGRRDVYLTVMHSGVTLGALVGRLAEAEILDGVQVDILAPFRLERFKT